MRKFITLAATVGAFAFPASAMATGNGNGNDKSHPPKQDHTCQGGHNCNDVYVTPMPGEIPSPAPVVIVAPQPTAPDIKQDQTQGSTTVNIDNSTTIVLPPAPAAPAASPTAPILKLKGNTLRTLHVAQRKGAKIVKIKARLLNGNQNLTVRGNRVFVDLRGKSTGNYNVYITTTYRRSNGKTVTVRTTRNLSVTVTK